MPLAVLERFQRTESEEEAESRDSGDRGLRREREMQRAVDTETPSDRDREK